MKENKVTDGPSYAVCHTLGGLAIPGDVVTHAELKDKYRTEININALIRDGFIKLMKPEPDLNDKEGRANKAARALVESQKKASKKSDKKAEKVEEPVEVPAEAETVEDEDEAPTAAEVSSKQKLEDELQKKTIDELNQIIKDECDLKAVSLPTSWPYSTPNFAIKFILKSLA